MDIDSTENSNSQVSPFTTPGARVIRRFGLAKSLLGTLSVAFGIAASATLNKRTSDYYSLNGYVGAGIWCGLFAIASGAVELITTHSAILKRVKVCIALNITLICLALAMTSMSIYSLITTSKPCGPKDYRIQEESVQNYEQYSSYYYYFYDEDDNLINTIPGQLIEKKDFQCPRRKGLAVIDVSLFIIGICLVVTGIIALRLLIKTWRMKMSPVNNTLRDTSQQVPVQISGEGPLLALPPPQPQGAVMLGAESDLTASTSKEISTDPPPSYASLFLS